MTKHPFHAPVPRMTPERLARRAFLRRSGLVVGGLAAAPWLLAACGGDDDDTGGATGGGGGGGTVRISNWPFYIDADDAGDPSKGQTIPGFEALSGYDVVYDELVNDNDEWFAKFSPDLAAGNPIGLDIAVLTTWMVERLIGLGYLEELDMANLPNVANLDPVHAAVAWDPGRRFSLPWASGLGGIAYNPTRTGRAITSVSDLFDPEFAGHVTVLTEMRDTLGLTMLSMGIDVTACTPADAQAAAAKLKAATEAGQFRRATGNDYVADLLTGDTWLAVAWSGDIISAQLEDPDLIWIAPDEGTMLFTDTMIIPRGAANKAGAEAWMNHVYDPAISAQIFAYTQYQSPVVGTKEKITELDPALAENPLIFPPADVQARTFTFKTLSDEEQIEFTTLFQDSIQA